MLWWALDEIRVQVTGRSGRYSQVVLELAWNPGPGADASLAAHVLAGMTKPAQLWAPIGSVVLVAPGAGAHPGVEPAVDKVQELWPAAVVTVVDEAVAALAGAGLDPEPAACVVVHQDGLHTSVAVVAGREAIAGDLATGGTRGLAQAVVEHLRAERRLDAGLEQAWAAVVHGSVFVPSSTVPGPVYGSVITEDRVFPAPPGKVTLSPTELRAVVAPAYQPVVGLVEQVLREAPPETVRQATAGGLLLTGPHPPGAEDHLTDLTGLPARRVVEPKAGHHRLQVLLDGVARLLAEKPPAPVIAEHRIDLAEKLQLLEKLGLRPPRDLNADDR
ncbi:rod shape-determining protein [Streptomyces sp. NPDC059629]|uniref:rod shape-determining protein n=1 Tax=Streptomyces sp. NPDC059629 TaxID=3346889 RepID=UPI0036A1AF4B